MNRKIYKKIFLLSEFAFLLFRKAPLNGVRFDVALYQQRSVASLKSDRHTLEEMFYFIRVVFSPPTSAMSSHVLQTFHSIRVPAPKSFNNKWQKVNALRAAVVKVLTVFGGFSHLDGRSGGNSSAVKDSVLGRRNDADVEGHFLPVDPGGDENVPRA